MNAKFFGRFSIVIRLLVAIFILAPNVQSVFASPNIPMWGIIVDVFQTEEDIVNCRVSVTWNTDIDMNFVFSDAYGNIKTLDVHDGRPRGTVSVSIPDGLYGEYVHVEVTAQSDGDPKPEGGDSMDAVNNCHSSYPLTGTATCNGGSITNPNSEPMNVTYKVDGEVKFNGEVTASATVNVDYQYTDQSIHEATLEWNSQTVSLGTFLPSREVAATYDIVVGCSGEVASATLTNFGPGDLLFSAKAGEEDLGEVIVPEGESRILRGTQPLYEATTVTTKIERPDGTVVKETWNQEACAQKPKECISDGTAPVYATAYYWNSDTGWTPLEAQRIRLTVDGSPDYYEGLTIHGTGQVVFHVRESDWGKDSVISYHGDERESAIEWSRVEIKWAGTELHGFWDCAAAWAEIYLRYDAPTLLRTFAQATGGDQNGDVIGRLQIPSLEIDFPLMKIEDQVVNQPTGYAALSSDDIGIHFVDANLTELQLGDIVVIASVTYHIAGVSQMTLEQAGVYVDGHTVLISCIDATGSANLVFNLELVE